MMCSSRGIESGDDEVSAQFLRGDERAVAQWSGAGFERGAQTPAQPVFTQLLERLFSGTQRRFGLPEASGRRPDLEQIRVQCLFFRRGRRLLAGQ